MFLIFLGWCLVLFYSAIPLEFKKYIVEKNEVLLINASDTINLLSKNPDKSKFIFICSFYFGLFFLFFHFFMIVYLKDFDKFEVDIPLYKAIPTLLFSYVFLSSFYVFGLIFPDVIPRIDRLLWSGGLISNIALVVIMVCQGLLSIIIFQIFYLIGKLIKGEYYGR
ncbi:hypothetical protein [Avibacterium sp. 21-599]|uniref:hypothetical protein n=1 Tax=Avibacterium sp. 21-599 TaxID=2911528 RepID=UPI0022480851|nr:hypothetical protein [Avibacterium sp. 21-599]MCW9718523.1 hypothetical protein [Avibacterium sp. 21-599]